MEILKVYGIVINIEKELNEFHYNHYLYVIEKVYWNRIKRASMNFMILLSDENPEIIYKRIKSKMESLMEGFSNKFIIVEISKNLYGDLPSEVFDWLNEKL
jgi:hypothetical protein